MPYVFRSIYAPVQKVGFPAGTPPQVRGTGRFFCCASLPLWATSGICDGALFRALGVTVTVCAVVCWAVAQLRDSDMRALNRAYADALRRLPEDERREVLVRVVSGR